MKKELEQFINDITVEDLKGDTQDKSEKVGTHVPASVETLQVMLTDYLPKEIITNPLSTSLAVLTLLPPEKRSIMASLTSMIAKVDWYEDAIKRNFGDKAVEGIELGGLDKTGPGALALLCTNIKKAHPEQNKDEVLLAGFIYTMMAGEHDGSAEIVFDIIDGISDEVMGHLISEVKASDLKDD